METISDTSQKLGYLEDFGGMDIQFQYQLFTSYFGKKQPGIPMENTTISHESFRWPMRVSNIHISQTSMAIHHTEKKETPFPMALKMTMNEEGHDFP